MHSEEDVSWKQRFNALSDQSDSTIKLLKKENQRLRVMVEKLEDQLPTQMEQPISTAFIKAEPLEEDTFTKIPRNPTSPSIAGRLILLR